LQVFVIDDDSDAVVIDVEDEVEDSSAVAASRMVPCPLEDAAAVEGEGSRTAVPAVVVAGHVPKRRRLWKKTPAAAWEAGGVGALRRVDL
jgi:hypothetical protein